MGGADYSTRREQNFQGNHSPRRTDLDKRGWPLCSDQDTGKLEVAVHIAQVVAEVHHNYQLLEHSTRHVQRQLATLPYQQLLKADACGEERRVTCVLMSRKLSTGAYEPWNCSITKAK